MSKWISSAIIGFTGGAVLTIAMPSDQTFSLKWWILDTVLVAGIMLGQAVERAYYRS